MFGIGVQELAIIFVIALLIFGPKRLPELARAVGKGLAEIRRASGDLRQTFDLSADPPPLRPPPPPANPPTPEDPRTARELDSRPAQAIGSGEDELGEPETTMDAVAPAPEAANEEDPSLQAPVENAQGEKARD